MRDILQETSPSPETNLQTGRGETLQEMSTAGVPLEKTPDYTLENSLEDTDPTQETSPEGGMNRKGMKTQEGKEDLTIGIVILAMGVDVENAARRPCVMRVPCRRPHGQAHP